MLAFTFKTLLFHHIPNLSHPVSVITIIRTPYTESRRQIWVPIWVFWVSLLLPLPPSLLPWHKITNVSSFYFRAQISNTGSLGLKSRSWHTTLLSGNCWGKKIHFLRPLASIGDSWSWACGFAIWSWLCRIVWLYYSRFFWTSYLLLRSCSALSVRLW